MNLLLIILMVGIVLYFLLKMVLLLLRPFFLAKFLKNIEMLYSKTKTNTSKDIDKAVEDLRKRHAAKETMSFGILTCQKKYGTGYI